MTITFPTKGVFNGLEVRVGDDASGGGKNNPLCSKFTIEPTRPASLWCGPTALTGRYLSLHLVGGGKMISACEVAAYATCVSVHGNCQNMALKQPTKQSTTGQWTVCLTQSERNVSLLGWGGSSGRAVDGNGNRWYGGRSCTHTNGQTNPWWYVDLGGQQPVRKIQVTNR